jgi:hypothetical protein
VDDDPDQQSDDLLTQLVGQPGVQSRPDVVKEVTGLLGHDLRT